MIFKKKRNIYKCVESSIFSECSYHYHNFYRLRILVRWKNGKVLNRVGTLMKKKLNIDGHVLLLKHTKLNEKDSEKLLKDYNITKRQLPIIFKSDSSLNNIKDIEAGDIIEITRPSTTSKNSKYFRVVIDA